MEYELNHRLNRVIGEHKINLMSPKGLLDISIMTIEAVKASQIALGFWKEAEIKCLDKASGILRNSR